MDLLEDLCENLSTLLQEGRLTTDHLLALEQKLHKNISTHTPFDWPQQLVSQIKNLSLEYFSEIVQLANSVGYYQSLTLIFVHTPQKKEYYQCWGGRMTQLLTGRASITMLLHAQGFAGAKFFVEQIKPGGILEKMSCCIETFFQEMINWQVAHSQNLAEADTTLSEFFLQAQFFNKFNKMRVLQPLILAFLHELPQTVAVLNQSYRSLSPEQSRSSEWEIKSDLIDLYLGGYLNPHYHVNRVLDEFCEVIENYKFFKTRKSYRNNLEKMMVKMLLIYKNEQHDPHFLKESYAYFTKIAQQYYMPTLYAYILEALMATPEFELKQISRVMPVFYYETLLTHDCEIVDSSKKTISHTFRGSKQYQYFLTHASEGRWAQPFLVTPYFLNMALKNKAKDVVACYEKQLQDWRFSTLWLNCHNGVERHEHRYNGTVACLLSADSLLCLKKWHNTFVTQCPTEKNPIIPLLQKMAELYDGAYDSWDYDRAVDNYPLEICQMNVTMLVDLLLSNDERREIAQKSKNNHDPQKNACAALISIYQKGVISWVRKHTMHRALPALQIFQNYVENDCLNQPILGNIAIYQNHCDLDRVYDKYEKTSRNVFPLLYSTSNGAKEGKERAQLK